MLASNSPWDVHLLDAFRDHRIDDVNLFLTENRVTEPMKVAGRNFILEILVSNDEFYDFNQRFALLERIMDGYPDVWQSYWDGEPECMLEAMSCLSRFDRQSVSDAMKLSFFDYIIAPQVEKWLSRQDTRPDHAQAFYQACRDHSVLGTTTSVMDRLAQWLDLGQDAQDAWEVIPEKIDLLPRAKTWTASLNDTLYHYWSTLPSFASLTAVPDEPVPWILPDLDYRDAHADHDDRRIPRTAHSFLLKKIEDLKAGKNVVISEEEWQSVTPKDCMHPAHSVALDSQKKWPAAMQEAVKPGLRILYERFKDDPIALNQSNVIRWALLAGDAALVDLLLDRKVDASQPGSRGQGFLLDLFFLPSNHGCTLEQRYRWAMRVKKEQPEAYQRYWDTCPNFMLQLSSCAQDMYDAKEAKIFAHINNDLIRPELDRWMQNPATPASSIHGFLRLCQYSKEFSSFEYQTPLLAVMRSRRDCRLFYAMYLEEFPQEVSLPASDSVRVQTAVRLGFGESKDRTSQGPSI
jgi:hypothetical protein